MRFEKIRNVKIRILPSSPEHPDTDLFLTTFVVDDRLAVDAGSLGVAGSHGQYAEVGDILLTHSHVDHIATLPVHVERRFAASGQPVTVYGRAETVASLRQDVFNDRVWPDLIRIGEHASTMLRLEVLESEKSVSVAGFTVTPVPVDHTVPTFGYVVDDGSVAVVFGGDSGPTDRVWEVALATGRLGAAFIEASFPDRLADLAELTGHLTPAGLAAEAAKLPDDIPVYAVHIKPDYREEVESELSALASKRIRIGRGRHDYRF
jgi:cAMP phosphodiesterase